MKPRKIKLSDLPLITRIVGMLGEDTMDLVLVAMGMQISRESYVTETDANGNERLKRKVRPLPDMTSVLSSVVVKWEAIQPHACKLLSDLYGMQIERIMDMELDEVIELVKPLTKNLSFMRPSAQETSANEGEPLTENSGSES